MFEVDPDIKKAETLSSRFYTEESFFYETKEKIFSRSWHLVDRVDDTVNLRPVNILDTPILISNDHGDLNCFSNVCTHRGAILIESNCYSTGIRCPYHGRRFDLKGKFLSMPEFEEVDNFPTQKDDLPKIPFGIWGDFIFASLNPLAPLDDFLTQMKQTVSLSKNYRLTAIKDYEVRAHWALYCENYLEGFHFPFVHKSLNELIDYGSYQTETFRYSSLQTAFDKNGEIAAHYFFIFPNLMFNFYPWGLSVNIVKPQTINNTIVTYLTLVSDKSKLNTGAGGDLERVELEDQAIVESVQKGIRSRFFEKGRYSPTREQGTHHFHRLICEFMK